MKHALLTSALRSCSFIVIILLSYISIPQVGCSEDDDIEAPYISDTICNNVCFSRYNEGLFSCHQECLDDNDVRLPAGIDFLVKNIREKIVPPVFKDRTLDPPEPSGGDKLKFTLSSYNMLPTYMENLRVKLFYSFDDYLGEWNSTIPVYEELEEEEGIWTAEIDVDKDAENLYLLTRAGDNDGNTFIDLPCPPPPHSGAGTDECFFPLSPDDTYQDIEGFDIDPALDITDSYVAADEKFIYFRLKTVGKINPGDIYPSQYNYYLFGIFDPGRPTEVDPYHKTLFVLYSPYYFQHEGCTPDAFKTVSTNIQDMTIPICSDEPCALLMRQGPEWRYDVNLVRCEEKDNEIFVAMKRKAIEPLSMGLFVVYSATGIIMDPETGIVVDYSLTTTVNPVLAPIAIK